MGHWVRGRVDHSGVVAQPVQNLHLVNYGRDNAEAASVQHTAPYYPPASFL